jgi:hypothetical protein
MNSERFEGHFGWTRFLLLFAVLGFYSTVPGPYGPERDVNVKSLSLSLWTTTYLLLCVWSVPRTDLAYLLITESQNPMGWSGHKCKNSFLPS